MVLHIHGGVFNDLRAFATPEEADKLEQEWCKNLDIPYDAEQRAKYYEEHEVDDDILRIDADVE